MDSSTHGDATFVVFQRKTRAARGFGFYSVRSPESADAVVKVVCYASSLVSPREVPMSGDITRWITGS